jgi:5-methylcytosine-specific restriction endonuclease McrBC GTP-binding regulatory subunit McrB
MRQAAAEGREPAPFFVILDEMNLARVEHYFSDFSRAWSQPIR